MKNKKSIIIMIIIIVLILAVISGIFMYNKFQQQELKQLTEEANKLLQQDLINDEIDNEIIIDQTCNKCSVCVDVCPTGAIHKE